MSYNDFNDPRMVTPTGNPDAPLPKGEPIAKAPQTAPEGICDPRELLRTELVAMKNVEVGDFIRANGWTNPRRVEHIDQNELGPVLSLAEYDESRVNTHGIRRVDLGNWLCRNPWVRYPNLRRLWDAAHGDS